MVYDLTRSGKEFGVELERVQVDRISLPYKVVFLSMTHTDNVDS